MTTDHAAEARAILALHPEARESADATTHALVAVAHAILALGNMPTTLIPAAPKPAAPRASDPRSPLITVQEAAAHLGVTDRSIRRWISEGILTAHRVGKKQIRIDRTELARVTLAIPTGGQS